MFFQRPSQAPVASTFAWALSPSFTETSTVAQQLPRGEPYCFRVNENVVGFEVGPPLIVASRPPSARFEYRIIFGKSCVGFSNVALSGSIFVNVKSVAGPALGIAV